MFWSVVRWMQGNPAVTVRLFQRQFFAVAADSPPFAALA